MRITLLLQQAVLFICVARTLIAHHQNAVHTLRRYRSVAQLDTVVKPYAAGLTPKLKLILKI